MDMCCTGTGTTSIRPVIHRIDKTSENPLCRLFGKEGERVQHLIRGLRNWLKKNRRDDTTM